MTTTFPPVIAAAILFLLALPHAANALGGSAATVAVVYGSATTVCSIAAEQPIRQIQCWSNGQLLPPILPTISFDAVSGGLDTLCGVRSGGSSLLCWNTTFTPKRLYSNASAPLTSLSIGDTQICALRNTTAAICWRGNNVSGNPQFRAISSGLGFSCGILRVSNQVLCWGNDGFSDSIQSEFANSSMVEIEVGGRHACGFNTSGFVVCRGSNSNGQLNLASNSAFEYRSMAVGANHSCAIRTSNGTVVCWGGNGQFSSNFTDSISFESIVAGLNFTCGLTTSNFSVICWGPGWPNQSGTELPLQKTLPGPCINTPCPCNLYPESQRLCSGNGHICRPCDLPILPPTFPSPPRATSPSPSPSPSRGLRRGLLAFAIIGSVGCFSGICSVIYCLWAGGFFGKKKIHNSVQPTITAAHRSSSNSTNNSNSNSNPPSRSSTLRRQASILMRRQRSGTSSKHADKAEEFAFSHLAEATNNFSPDNKIGAGSFGSVYRGKLPNGRLVAIKRSETGPKAKKFQEKESAFESELSFLSRLHHKHLVRLVGYCEERDERLLVYEYMKNGALHDHLHSKNNAETVINSWKMRIKISLDAARGIEYLHSYAVPPIIHRDIKSSNILIDADWTGRVSDFGLSLMGDRDNSPIKAAGTMGYIDPEYYGLNVLTAKSDVYGFGIVLLEVLTGKRAIFKVGDEPMSVVDYAVPAIMAGEVGRILDGRVGPAETNESEAVELVAYTAMHCVHLEGKDRPWMTDIVANLERALALCQDSHGSVSSGQISTVSVSS